MLVCPQDVNGITHTHSKYLPLGWHEGRSIPRDSLFVMLGLTGIISVYDKYGKQIGNDNTSWDIYAASNNGDAVINYWAIDKTGSYVGKFDVPKIGGVAKW